MKPNRREFLNAAALLSFSPIMIPLDPLLRLQPADGRVFLHGVASGDPRHDRVILWTRISGSAQSARPRVRWEVARDPDFRQIVERGETRTDARRDFTVKVDAAGLRPQTTYYYRFIANGEQSSVGRTRTLPERNGTRLRVALASCANLPAGFFNAYRGIANRHDLDVVVHLGDYIYEYQNARYGDGTAVGRVPSPDRELVTLDDYRTRHAQYKTDPDLQEAHRQHPWITVWDDHEIANNTWRDGASNHNPDQGEGSWVMRRAAAVRAYYEWMPIRASGSVADGRIYRTFRFGSLADLIMLDTRLVGRDQQAPRDRRDQVEDPARSLLGPKQEDWLFDELQKSRAREARWQLLGQQVNFAPNTPWGRPPGNADAWDGYRPARDRIVDFLETNRMRSAVVLTGDVHSSWAYDVAKDPWENYQASTGKGAVAVELVTPSVTSPTGWNPQTAERRRTQLLQARPHLRWVEGLSHGYIVLTVSTDAIQGDWFAVPTIESRVSEERFEKGFTSVHDEPHFVEAGTPAPPTTTAADPAP
jgi:alkaline phosphatase D